MDRYTDFLFRNRTWILGVVGCITLVCLAVIPSLKITDRGLVDVERFSLVPLWVEPDVSG